MRLGRIPRSFVIASILLPLTFVSLQARTLFGGSSVATLAPTTEPSARSFSLELTPELEEIADWLQSDSRSFVDGLALSQAVWERTDSFRVFTELHDPETRRVLLAELPYGVVIEEMADRYELDPLLVAAVVEVESSFRPEVGSHKGAVGLMQLLPSTAGMSRSQLQDPETNVEAGAKYLDYLRERFDEDLPLTLAAYNAGPTVVSRVGGIPPYPETRDYVEKVLGRYVEHHRSLWRMTGSDRELSRLLSI